jgi:hypothetical protein
LDSASAPIESAAKPVDYDRPAELFPTRFRKGPRQSLAYRRFARLADAVRFAVEELPAPVLLGTYLEVDEERFDGEAIRRLYDSPDYPLARSSSG